MNCWTFAFNICSLNGSAGFQLAVCSIWLPQNRSCILNIMVYTLGIEIKVHTSTKLLYNWRPICAWFWTSVSNYPNLFKTGTNALYPFKVKDEKKGSLDIVHMCQIKKKTSFPLTKTCGNVFILLAISLLLIKIKTR